MSSAVQPRLVGCTVVEQAFVCPTGGGFENETWRVQVNDDWLTISELLRRRPAGDVTAELVDGHDPNGVESSGIIPPQTAFHRRTYVVAPVGTKLSKRVIRPVIDSKKTFRDCLLAGDVSVPRKTFDYHFVLRGPERLVSLALDVERRSRPKSPPVAALPREQTLQNASAVLSLLNSGADLAREVSRPTQEREPAPVAQGRRIRKPPVREGTRSEAAKTGPQAGRKNSA